VAATGNPVPGGPAGIGVGGLYASRDGTRALLEVNAFPPAGPCTLTGRPGTPVWPLAAVTVAALALCARVRLGRAADPPAACSPARAEVAVPGLVLAVSGPLTALPVPVRR
jgi:hypothetical protein